MKKVEATGSKRLKPYREAIEVARDTWEVARGYGLIEDGKIPNKHKAQFVELCRATFPDHALAWLDASVVLLDDDIAFPLILGGAGGVIGSLDASFAFLKYLDDLGILDEQSSESTRRNRKQLDRRPLLQHALFRGSEARLGRGSTGQFDPGGVGGPNSSSTGDGHALANPWSYVLGMEGAMVCASGASRRLSAASQAGARKASMPFTVSATAVGYGSASVGEYPRGEFWAPLWRDAQSYRQIRHFVAEGRSQWGRNQARSGLDFVRAAATLGVDRSVEEFVRYLISVRHGQDVLAVPIGRFAVIDRVRPEAEILRQIDGWVGRARSKDAPAAMSTMLNALDRAQFSVATFGGSRRLQTVLAALAEAEHVALRSPAYRRDQRLDPIVGLSAREWVPLLNDDSAEFRIAVGLASLSDRVSQGRPGNRESAGVSLAMILRPVSRSRYGLSWSTGGPRVGRLGQRPTLDVLNDVVGARATLAASTRSADEDNDPIPGLPFAFDYGLSVDLADVARLLCGQLDGERLGAILAGLLLLDWTDSFRAVADCLVAPLDPAARLHAVSLPIYVVLVPFFAGRLPVAPTDTDPSPSRSVAVRPRPEWVGAIRTGSAHTAARAAAQLLRGRGWKLICDNFERTSVDTGCLATALLLHLDRSGGDQRQIRYLLDQQSTAGNRWLTSRDNQEGTHEQA